MREGVGIDEVGIGAQELQPIRVECARDALQSISRLCTIPAVAEESHSKRRVVSMF